MKRTRHVGYSTLGCPGESVEQLITRSHGGAGGVELRIADGEVLTPDSSTAAATELGARFAEAGVDLLCLSGYVQMCAPGPDALERLLDLAEAAGAGGVRVFMRDESRTTDSTDEPTTGERRALDRLAQVRGHRSRILIETHDSHSSAERLAAFLRRADAEVPGHGAGVLWDTAHTWRSGEHPETSLAALQPWLAHLQVKDVADRSDPTPVPLGAGAYPVADLGAALDANEWSGWVVLEWERTWFPELPDLDSALGTMREWAAPLGLT